MPSPFPGMDPYLEPHWLDVHTRLVAYTADALNEQLPADLVASTEERVAIEGDEVGRVLGPDVRIVEPLVDAVAETEDSAASGSVALAYRVIAQVEPITERYIKIIDMAKERLVTVIEYLSPTNKRGEGLLDFRSKRAEFLATGVRFVEIDLVRAGDWRRLMAPHKTKQGAAVYRATIRLPGEPSVVHLQPIRLQDALPTLPIPLRSSDANATLALQPLIENVYDKGRYARRINYRVDPVPALDAEDAVWADELLRSTNRR